MSSNIPLDDWVAMESMVKRAKSALDELSTFLHNRMLHHMQEQNKRELKTFMELDTRINETKDALYSHGWWIQSEWTGGDSSDPRNSTLREPNIAGPITHSFPKEQVDKYRQPDGDIRIPHRVKVNEEIRKQMRADGYVPPAAILPPIPYMFTFMPPEVRQQLHEQAAENRRITRENDESLAALDANDQLPEGGDSE